MGEGRGEGKQARAFAAALSERAPTCTQSSQPNFLKGSLQWEEILETDGVHVYLWLLAT